MDWNTRLEQARAVAQECQPPTRRELDRLLETAAADALSLEDANRLLNLLHADDFPVLVERVLEVSREVRRRVFGNRVAVMAPVEVSNRCASDCLFCGWRVSNPDIPRMRITRDLMLEQVDYLLELGIDYIEIVGGDDFGFVQRDLPDLVRAVRGAMRAKSMEGQVCICSMAVTGDHYRDWRDWGVDSVFVWQETYDPRLYAEKIVAGPKAHGITADWKLGAGGDGYRFRLDSQERAARAGLDVGLGFMLGLAPALNVELLMALQHVQLLLALAPAGAPRPVIIGMPTWNRITTPRTDMRPGDPVDAEKIFTFLAAVFFLALPKGPVWVFPNCRVSLATQVRAVEVAGAFTSTEVKLGPGGYLPALLRRREAQGADTGALRRQIHAELGLVSDDLEQMEASLDSGEQFRHHFHPHQVYVDAMRRRDLEIVPFTELAGLLSPLP